MRTRTRVTLSQQHVEDCRCPVYPGGINVLRNVSTDYPPYVNETGCTETIVDDPTPGLWEKDVKHLRYSVDDHPPLRQKLGFSRYSPLAAHLRAENDWLYDTNSPHWMLQRYGSYLRTLRPLEASSLPTLADVPTSVQIDAFEHMMPKVNDGLSLVNFILELKDLRRMFDFKTLERELRYGYRKFGILSSSISKRQAGRNRWEELKNAANDFLNYSFGWKPFLGDLSKMYKALSGLDTRLSYLERNQGRALTRHYVKTLDVPEMPCSTRDFLTDIDMYNLFWTGGAHNTYGAKASVYRKDTYEYQPRYHATINYSYSLPNYGVWTSIRRKIRGFLDALGVRLDPSIVWNAIPYSFVVDWVVDVGSWLRQFSPNDLGLEVVINDASHSVKYQQVSQFTASLPVLTPEVGTDPRTTSHYIEDIALSDVTRAYYERKRWNPSLLFAGVSFPTLMQWSLGGALAITQNRRRFRRG